MTTFESVEVAMREAWEGGHQGLIDLIAAVPEDRDQATQLATLSTCALAIRAALYVSGERHNTYTVPYRTMEAMTDLWDILGIPWGRSVWKRDIRRGGVWLVGGASHVVLGRYVGAPDTGAPGYIIGFEAGQTDGMGQQVVEPVIYRTTYGGSHARRMFGDHRSLDGFVEVG